MNPKAHTAGQAALEIIKKLRSGGHVALLAGGCVRDMLLDRSPKDFDVATDAKPDRVQELFSRTRLVGARFGVVLVHKSGFDIEVATFRSDGPYSDGRHPDAVRFGTEIEDARRRDFTINGLFFDPIDDRVIDHVGGREDLKVGIIRTIGEPDHRFAEDHLRMLRAIRLAARLGFTIDAGTAIAIERHAPHLRAISPERIWQELEEIITGPTRMVGWSRLVELGLCDHLVGGVAFDRRTDSAIRHRLSAFEASSIDASLGLAILLCDGTSNSAEAFCRALRLSNRLTDAVVWLVSWLPMLRNESCLELADLKTLMAEQEWPQLLELLRVKLISDGADLSSYESVQRRAKAIDPRDVAPPPLFSGDDLTALGMPPGPRFGEILKTVFRAQLNENIKTKAEARELAENLMKEG